MSILINSKNIFLSTQPSGGLSGGGIDDQLNSFRAALNNVPLQTANGEYGKLTLIDFTMFRNFYKVNQNNNTFFMQVTVDGEKTEKKITIPPGDYRLGEELSTAVANAVLKEFKTFNANATVSGIKPSTDRRINQNGDGVLQFTLNKSGQNNISAVKFQCRNYDNGSGGTDGDFNDSYSLLGARRITKVDATYTETSLNSAPSGVGEEDFVVRGFYQMQDTTIPNVFVRCGEVIDNLESENFKMGQNGSSDTHITGSTILGKVE